MPLLPEDRRRTQSPVLQRSVPTGVTLLEMLLVLALVAILAAIALPGYAGHVAQARRSHARLELMQLAHWLERAATATGAYPLPEDIPQALLLQVPGGHYRLHAEGSGTSFRLEARPTGSQAGDRCGTLVLLHTGEREILHAHPDADIRTCWGL